MTLIPSRAKFARVRRVRGRHGGYVWQAYCTISRCKFSEDHPTHNGSHMAAARHRRAKCWLKGHGAREVATP